MATTTVDEATAPAGTSLLVTRSITPRRGLPSGRAVVGALLVTLAAVGAFVVARGGERGPDTSYLVASRRITVGDRVTTDHLTAVPIELPDFVAASALAAGATLDGATALHDIEPGELLAARDLLPAATAGDQPIPARHELTLPIDRQRASRQLLAGDRVTVLATVPNADPSTTVLAVEDALVVEWATGEDGIGTSATAALTLALADADTAMALAHLAHQGELTVVRTTRALDDEYPASYPSPDSSETRPADDEGVSAP